VAMEQIASHCVLYSNRCSYEHSDCAFPRFRGKLTLSSHDRILSQNSVSDKLGAIHGANCNRPKECLSFIARLKRLLDCFSLIDEHFLQNGFHTDYLLFL
jgi:hypothetical protein